VHPASTGTSETKVTVGVPHASLAVTVVTSAAGTVALQPSEISAGQVMSGAVLSRVHVTVLAAVAELPQPSEAVNVLICEALQALVIIGPSVNVTTGIPHAAVAVAEPSAAVISAAEGLQPRVTEAGVIIIVGGLGALVHVTVLEVVAVLPQASIAVNVLVCEALQEVVDTAPSDEERVGVPQASVAVADPRAALISEADGLQPSDVAVPVAVIVGGVISTVLVMS
jgi:hypothetical protein